MGGNGERETYGNREMGNIGNVKKRRNGEMGNREMGLAEYREIGNVEMGYGDVHSGGIGKIGKCRN